MADAVTEAQTLYRESVDALRHLREQIAEDIAFSDPSDPQQWDFEDKRRRETDPGGARPCLTFDQTGQYVANVAGQIEQRPPAMHALPVDGGADRKVAEQLDGYFRHIEHGSRAQQHYVRALTSAARCGVGYLIVRPEYIDRALGYQEPRISSEGDPLRVVFDPWSVELDGCDANFGFVLTPFSQREFKRRWPKADAVSFGSDDQRRSRDDRDSVIVAEGWQMVEQSTNCIVFIDQTGDEVALPEDQYWQASQRGQVMRQLRTYTDKTRSVKWSRMTGAEALEDSDYPADGIGIVPIYGYVGWADGRMTYCGIPRRARAPQQAYNFHMSEARAFMATSAKSPWIAPARAIRGYEKLWDRASAEQRAYLPYRDLDEDGPIQAPQRMSPSINLQNHIQGAEQALRDIQASIGMYQANLGAPSNESSGVAIDSRKQQGEASTAHFPAHQSASVARVGKLCLEMIPRLMDTKRQMRILGIDGTPGAVTVDPSQQEAIQETPQGLTINPNIGRYDVRVVVGAAFATQRSQAQQAFTEMMRANPAMAPAIAPLWAQTLDVPHADKLAQVLTAIAPDPVRQILQPESDKQPNTAQMAAKIDQLQQALNEAIQHAHAAQQDADEAEARANDKDEEAEARLAELSINRYKAKTDRIKVLLALAPQPEAQALAGQMVAETMDDPDLIDEPIEGPGPDGSMAHESAEGEQPETYEMQPFPAAMNEGMQQ